MKSENRLNTDVFDVGDNVSYGTAGICTITGIEKRCFDGENEYDYYMLSPINSKTSKYYLPVTNSEGKLRRLLSKDEIFELIDKAAEYDDEGWEKDSRERKAKFDSILNGDDFEKLLKMLKALYFQQERNKLSGKKLVNSDENAMKAAEGIVFQEFAIVLGIEYEDVENFILQRAKQTK